MLLQQKFLPCFQLSFIWHAKQLKRININIKGKSFKVSDLLKDRIAFMKLMISIFFFSQFKITYLDDRKIAN